MNDDEVEDIDIDDEDERILDEVWAEINDSEG